MEESLGVSLPFRLKIDFLFDSVSTARTSLSAPLRRFGDCFMSGLSAAESSKQGVTKQLERSPSRYQRHKRVGRTYDVMHHRK